MRKIFLFVVSVILAAGFFYFLSNFSAPETAQAGSEHNVSGWAWSETIGWISFNSTNQGAGTNYGVNVDSAGNLSGYAWSEHIGWISFNRTDTGNPPSDDPGAGSGPIAKFNRASGVVTGWARALAGKDPGAGGWDGWIHLKGANYGVTVNGCDWDGYAWGSDVVGWIHFKGANYGVVGTGDTCTNRPPSATISQQPIQPDYCVSGPAASFSWIFTDPDGDSQSAYQVQVDNNSDFSSPEDDSGKVSSDSQSYATPLGKLSYNTTYYWRLMVWDSKETASSWISGPYFKTALHAYPTVDFSWDLQNPYVGQVVKFTTDNSQCFDNKCDSWSWTFQDGDPSSSSQQNATTTFSSVGPKEVTLTVTDSDNFDCTAKKTISIGKPLPEWKEITPF